MKTKLRILLLEDDIADAEMIEHELEEDGFSFSLVRVQTEMDFRHELHADPPDLILSDHGLPSFDGFRALEMTRKLRPQMPFIFVTGSSDPGEVIEMYEQGATDYVFKRDLGDLKTAVNDALGEQMQTLRRAEPAATPDPAQPEFKLSFPQELPAPPLFAPAIGHLYFCPQCHQARDEAGQVVQLEDYCGNRIEIVIVRKTCAECKEPRWWS